MDLQVNLNVEILVKLCGFWNRISPIGKEINYNSAVILLSRNKAVEANYTTYIINNLMYLMSLCQICILFPFCYDLYYLFVIIQPMKVAFLTISHHIIDVLIYFYNLYNNRKYII